MLKNVIRTKEETIQYLCELRKWLDEVKDTPVEEMSDFFTQRITEYDKIHLEHWANEYKHISDFFEDSLSILLDIGCGTGLEFEAIYKRFPNVKITGVDLSVSMLNEIRKKYPEKEIELINADYFQYPFEAGKYDAAMSFETLHHFEYDKKQRIYDKIYKALKNSGYYIECDYIACCDEEERLCLEGYEYRRKKHNIPNDAFVHIDIPLTLWHQFELLKKAGFPSIAVLYMNKGTVIIKATKCENEKK